MRHVAQWHRAALMELIDTHCHLDLPEFDADREAVIARARACGVSRFVVPGVHRAEWPPLVALCHDVAGVHFALGLHPVYLEQHRKAHLRELDEWIARERPLAVGEIGLDFQLRKLDRNRQRRFLDAQLAIAKNVGLPVLLHVRKAHDEVLRALHHHRLTGGICHAFNGSLQQAHRYLDLGFKLGFGGMLTYERSTKLRALAQALPDSAFVLETDAPDMTVASHRYQRNSPEFLPEVLATLAALRNAEAAGLAALTTHNANQVLRLPQ